MEQGVRVQMDTWIIPKQTPSLQHSQHKCNRFSLELRSTLQETATRNMMLHEIPELSPQQSKADNCVWAYGSFRQTLEDQRVGCSSSPGISLGRLLGEYIYFCLLAWFFILFFVVPCAQKQTIYGIRKLWRNRFHLTTQKNLCEIWWTLLDLSENQEIFHSKCAESTQEWRIQMSLIWLQLGEKMRHTDEEKRHYWWKIALEYHSNLLSNCRRLSRYLNWTKGYCHY